jgi:CRISPR/Cas system CSM-associated protein Csm3 (group 7 of RAMP superfamily)
MISLNQLLQAGLAPSTLQLTAVLNSALCIGAGGSAGSLADKPIVRNAQSQLIIPASQLKGRLRHECEKLARGLGWQVFSSPVADQMHPYDDEQDGQFASVKGYKGYHCYISRIFGNPYLPSHIFVEDLVCQLKAEDLLEVIRPGVSINRGRGTAEDQKLYFLETSPANAELEFRGAIQFLPDCPAYTKPLILAGLRHIHALGGSKSSGLGWLTWKDLDLSLPDGFDWATLLPGGKLYESN